MTSQIDYTKPTAVVAFTADVRNNFLIAYNEITALQAITAPIPSQITSIINLINALGNGLPSGPPGAIQFFDPVTNTFGGTSNFTFDSTSRSITINLANNAFNTVNGTYTGVPANLTLTTLRPIVAEWDLISTDDLVGPFPAGSANYCSVWSSINMVNGFHPDVPADGGASSRHLGLYHDILLSGNCADAAALNHVCLFSGINPDGRQDSDVFSYFHLVDTAGTAFTSVCEGTQSIIASGVATPGNGGVATSGACFRNNVLVADEATSTSTSFLAGVMTVGGTVAGTFVVGHYVYGSNVPDGTLITALGTGTGGAGTYLISTSGTLSARFVGTSGMSSYSFIDHRNNSTTFNCTQWAGMVGNYHRLMRPTRSVISDVGIDLGSFTSWGGGYGEVSSITGTVLTVGGFVTGRFAVGDFVTGIGVTGGTQITSLGTGTGGAGTYNLNTASTTGAIVVLSSEGGNFPAITLSRHSQIDFCADIPGSYFMKMSKTENRLHINAASANGFATSMAFDSGVGNAQVEIPVTSADQSLELGVGLVSVVANSTVGFPSIGYNVKSGGGVNTWRYRATAKANWMQFNNGEFWFYCDPVGAANAVTPNNLVFKVQNNGILVPGTIFVEGMTTNKSLQTLDGSGLNIIGNDFTTTLAFFGQIGAPNLTFPAANSQIVIAGNQVLQQRLTGYSAFTGAVDRGTIYDTATITLQQLAERVAALQADSTTQGFIGA